ncbi:MAG: bifunctional DNA primase/polymerase, partial [Gemmataceae bacterium]
MSSNRKVVPTMTASDWPQAQEVQETHQQLEAQGFALVFITPGERNPMVKGWNTRHHPFEEYQQGQNLGILPGALSGGLVCIDIDEPSLLSLADQYLPETGRVEGRAGKLRSHRYYRVTDLAEHEVAMPQVAGGIGGPRTRQFTDTYTGKRLVDLLGTGSCVVCPPSLHQSGERRVWDCEGDPAVVRYADLVQAVENLITAGGLTFKKTQAAMPACVEEITAVDESKIPPMPERVERAQAYLAQM